MAVSQNLVVTPQAMLVGDAVVTAAKTTYNDTTNAVQLLTAGANGAVVYGITAIPRSTLAAATKLMLFRVVSGTVYYVKAVLVASYSSDAGTTIPTAADFGYTETSPLRLNASDQLWVGVYAAATNGICVTAQGENL